jgi:hypothetical protein
MIYQWLTRNYWGKIRLNLIVIVGRKETRPTYMAVVAVLAMLESAQKLTQQNFK